MSMWYYVPAPLYAVCCVYTEVPEKPLKPVPTWPTHRTRRIESSLRLIWIVCEVGEEEKDVNEECLWRSSVHPASCFLYVHMRLLCCRALVRRCSSDQGPLVGAYSRLYVYPRRRRRKGSRSCKEVQRLGEETS